MPHPRQHIIDLAVICRKKGIRHAVISPGSRSAPLIRAFTEEFGESISIVDERSAAYYALGMATIDRNPVVLICTSGTAVLNYGPALAEAYYQQVPLLAVTADRPREWIDQQDNQTLRQSGVFTPFIKRSFELPQSVHSEDDLWFAHRTLNEAINLATAAAPGPVHINVPLTEPLYGELPPSSAGIRLIQQFSPELEIRLPDELTREWSRAKRIMIIHGQEAPGSETARLLSSLSSNDGRIIVLAENIANIHGNHILTRSNLVLSHHRFNSPPLPDLILHSGGQVVSKALKGYLRQADAPCWRIGIDNVIIDSFKLASRVIPIPAAVFYRALLTVKPDECNRDYQGIWLKASSETDAYLDQFFQQIPFCDLAVLHRIHSLIPPDTIISLGNSSIVRYSQFFHPLPLPYYSNRGVSGIDGCVSTSAGIAYASGKLTLALLGDLGFLYDSNGLWNRALPAALRIVVINNAGGGIFHILKGPSEIAGFKTFIEANHPVNIHKLAEAFGIRYFLAENVEMLSAQWSDFFHGQGAAVLEVKTDARVSADTFRKLIGALG